MLRAIIFDLDDTLYEERYFFRSGFEVVAGFLDARGFGPTSNAVARLEYFHLQEGRQDVFQKLADELGFPGGWIPEIVNLFRSHKPAIQLAADSLEVLPRLRQRFRLGCVTDGWAAVQRAKLASLSVEPWLDAVVVADDYGREQWKPEPFPVLKCCELLGIEPAEAIFVGDNPARDMAGARSAGVPSVRVRRPGGYFARLEVASTNLRADHEVVSLYELEELLARL